MNHPDHRHMDTGAVREGTQSVADEHSARIIDEEVLIRNLFATDPQQGCEVLFQKYYKLLCSHGVRFVHSREIAEDIVGEIFCKFWSDRVYERITTSYRAYLFKAVRFSAYNYLRWELSKRKQDFDVCDLSVSIDSLQPEDTLLLEELSEEIHRIIEQLPVQCRRVFMLSRFENKKYAEIAAQLNISVKAVEAHISKALDVLRRRLKKGDLLALILLTALFLS